MFSQYFGQYLLSQGDLTTAQLAEVLELEKSIRVKLGILAMDAGYMTAKQVEEVHELQKRKDKRFGEIAVELGYVTDVQVETLLKAQNQKHLNLSQAIVDKGYMSLDEINRALEEYKRDSHLTDDQIKAITDADVDQIVRFTCDFSKHQDPERCYDFVALTLRNIVRFLNDVPVVGRNVEPFQVGQRWVIEQQIEGSHPLSVCMVMDDSVLLEVARRYSGEELSEIDELALDSAAEFLNVTNGIYLVNMSDRGIELDLTPQKAVRHLALPEKSFAIPITLPFGTMHLVLA